MLLRWFGVSGQEDDEAPETNIEENLDPEGTDEDGEETVDQPVPIPRGPKHTRKSSGTS